MDDTAPTEPLKVAEASRMPGDGPQKPLALLVLPAAFTRALHFLLEEVLAPLSSYPKDWPLRQITGQPFCLSNLTVDGTLRIPTAYSVSVRICTHSVFLCPLSGCPRPCPPPFFACHSSPPCPSLDARTVYVLLVPRLEPHCPPRRRLPTHSSSQCSSPTSSCCSYYLCYLPT